MDHALFPDTRAISRQHPMDTALAEQLAHRQVWFLIGDIENGKYTIIDF